VDPLAGLDLSPMLDVLAQKRLIFHDAGYDLRMLLADFDFRPHGEIFDTMLAARLVGLENVSLSALLGDILGVDLSKQNQRADWSKRPIAEALLAYAVEDIRYLGTLADHLAERLEQLGRTEWHREYCRWTIEQSQQAKTPQDPEKAWRIRGTFGLSPRQLAFFRAVWQWRQQQSDHADLSPFRIMHNEQLLELALWAERQKQIHPDKLPRLPRHCKGGRRRDLLKAMEAAAQLDPQQWPQLPRRERSQKPSAEVLSRAEQLKKECQNIADTLNLPPQLIASRKSLLAAVNTGADTVEKLLAVGWMRWQADLLLDPLRTVLHTTPGKGS
jgi:ribonuclease D